MRTFLRTLSVAAIVISALFSVSFLVVSVNLWCIFGQAGRDSSDPRVFRSLHNTAQ
jgi:hypothetical protein